MKWGAYLLLFLMLISAAQAATIKGSVYDFYLSPVEVGKVMITTEPNQQAVLVNSTYSFEVEAGEYDLFGYKLEDGQIVMAAKESLVVSNEGTYNIDLILFPHFESESILQESETLFQEQAGFNLVPIWLLFVGSMVVILGLLILAFYKLKRIKPVVLPKAEVKIDADLKKVLDFIKENDKRVTQKEIRKEFPLSEGKISLMISDLEEKGLVKRIKKGRGNIVVLK